MSKKKDLEIQKKNIEREDEAKKRIEQAKKEIEEILLKYKLSILPMIQVIDDSDNPLYQKAEKL